jgi:hypothetical protein
MRSNYMFISSERKPIEGLVQNEKHNRYEQHKYRRPVL